MRTGGVNAAFCQGFSCRAWVPSQCPHPYSGWAQHIGPTGPRVAFGKRATRSPAQLPDWLSALHPACPGVLSPAAPPALGRAVAMSPTASPRGHQPPPQGTRPGPASFWAPTWHRGAAMQQPAVPALFQRRRAWTWARGAVRTSTTAATTEISCQKGTAAAGRAAGTHRAPPVFYLLCFSCTGPSATGPADCSPPGLRSGRGCHVLLGATGCHPWGPLSVPTGVCGSCFPEAALCPSGGR